MRGLLKRRTHSPPSPTTEVINQLEKGFSMAIHELAIKSKENHDLRLALERKKQKRQRLTNKLPHTGSLTVEDDREAVRMLEEGVRLAVRMVPGRPLSLDHVHHQHAVSAMPWGIGEINAHSVLDKYFL